MPGGHAVCPYHEILDNVLCPVPFFDFEITDFIAVKYRPRLNGFKTKRAVHMPEVLHALRCLVLQAQIFPKAIYRGNSRGHNSIPLKPCGNAVIGELCMIADTRSVDITLH